MPLPSTNYMTLVGGLNSTNSTIHTNNLIKIGDVVKISGTTSNNGTFTVTDIVSNSSTGEGSGTTFTDTAGSGSSGNSVVLDGTNTQVVAGRINSRWSGKNSFGVMSPTGIYFLQVEAGSNYHVQKLALVK